MRCTTASARVTCWAGVMWSLALDIDATTLPSGAITKVVRAKKPCVMA